MPNQPATEESDWHRRTMNPFSGHCNLSRPFMLEQNLRIAERTQDPVKIMFARWALGVQLHCVGEFAQALDYIEQANDWYDPEEHRSLVFKFGMDAGTYCPNWAAYALWYLGIRIRH